MELLDYFVDEPLDFVPGTEHRYSNSNYVTLGVIVDPYAAGAMCSTVEDLYRWDQALYTEALVSAATLERMFTPGLGDYGFGWYIDELMVDGRPHKQIWHWGAYFGFHGYIARLVDDRVTIIL